VLRGKQDEKTLPNALAAAAMGDDDLRYHQMDGGSCPRWVVYTAVAGDDGSLTSSDVVGDVEIGVQIGAL
jgi:hypothetical protein